MHRNQLTARLLLAMGLGATMGACGGSEDGTGSSATAGSGGAAGATSGAGGATSGAGGSSGGSGGTTAAGSGGSTSGSGGSTSGSGGSAGSLGGTGGTTAGTGGAGAGGSCTTSCSESVLCYAPDGSRATTDPNGGPTSCAAAVHAVGGTCPSIPLQQTECFPLGTCWQPSAVAVTTPVGDACCYEMKVCVNSCCGRPIFVDGAVRVAALVRGDRWVGAPSWV